MGKLGPLFRQIKNAFESIGQKSQRMPELPRQHQRQMSDMRTRVQNKDTYDGGGNGDVPHTQGHKPEGGSRGGDSGVSDGAPPIDRSKNPDWLNDRLDRTDLPFWRRRMAEGDQFNYQNHDRYPHNEVRTGDGKFLDSYRPPREIVSRKNTQLSDVRPETAMRYLDEISSKYWPGTRTDPEGPFKGEVLRGRPYLEVPVQNGAIPQDVINYANSFKPPIIIRDPNGHRYN